MTLSMRIRKIVLPIGLTLLAIILITEITLRITVAGKLQKWGGCQYQFDPVIGYRYKANAHGIIYNAAYSRPYKINSRGFAGDDFSFKKPKGIYRIVVVGASEEAGLFTNGPQSFLTMAEGLLKSSGYKVEIISLSIDGHGRSEKNIGLAKRAGVEYEPDLILLKDLDFPLADLAEYRTMYEGIVIRYTDTSQSNLDAARAYIDGELAHKDFRLYLFDYSYIYRWMVKYFLSQYQKQHSNTWQWFGELLFANPNKMECYVRHSVFWPGYQFDPSFYTKEESIQAYQDLRDTLSERNTKLIIFNNYAIDSASSVIRYFARYGLVYLPLQVVFKKEYSFGAEDEHTSQEGHQAIGYALFNALKGRIPR
jgi:hypothetical protein